MNRSDYDAIDAANFSTLKHILPPHGTPAHYQAALQDQKEKRELDPESEEGKEERTRYIVGTLLHSLTLENKDLRQLFAIKPAGLSFAKTDGKIWKAEQTLPIITQAEADGAPRMAEAIANDPDAREILDLCPMREHAIVTELDGVKMKALLDAYGSDNKKVPMIADVKTCRDVSRRAFETAIQDRDYDFQAEWYSRLTKAHYKLDAVPEFVWICVENKRPFSVQVYYPDADAWRSGRQKADRALASLKECRASGKWPSYGGGLKAIGVPGWRAKEL